MTNDRSNGATPPHATSQASECVRGNLASVDDAPKVSMTLPFGISGATPVLVSPRSRTSESKTALLSSSSLLSQPSQPSQAEPLLPQKPVCGSGLVYPPESPVMSTLCTFKSCTVAVF